MEKILSTVGPFLLGLIFLMFLCYPLIFMALRWRAKQQGSEGVSAWTLAAWLTMMLFVYFFFVTNFLSFNAKAKQSEAKTDLGWVFTAQQKYHAEHGAYAGGPNAFDLMDWKPAGEPMYAYYCGEAVIVNTKGVDVAERPDGNWPYKLRPRSSSAGFTCMAVGNVDNDEFLDVWAIDDSKRLHNVINDVGNFEEGQWNPANTDAIFGLAMFVVCFGILVALAIKGSRERKRARVDRERGLR